VVKTKYESNLHHNLGIMLQCHPSKSWGNNWFQDNIQSTKKRIPYRPKHNQVSWNGHWDWIRKGTYEQKPRFKHWKRAISGHMCFLGADKLSYGRLIQRRENNFIQNENQYP